MYESVLMRPTPEDEARTRRRTTVAVAVVAAVLLGGLVLMTGALLLALSSAEVTNAAPAVRASTLAAPAARAGLPGLPAASDPFDLALEQDPPRSQPAQSPPSLFVTSVPAAGAVGEREVPVAPGQPRRASGEFSPPAAAGTGDAGRTGGAAGGSPPDAPAPTFGTPAHGAAPTAGSRTSAQPFRYVPASTAWSGGADADAAGRPERAGDRQPRAVPLFPPPDPALPSPGATPPAGSA